MANPGNDRRQHVRMELGSEILIRYPTSPKVYTAIGKNLSATGILFETEESLKIGAEILIQVLPADSSTTPLDTHAEILRCEFDNTRALYCIAAKFTQVK